MQYEIYIDSVPKKSDKMGMQTNTKREIKPRKRDNETVRREVPSETREAFLDKCSASQYNRQIGRMPSEFMCEPESSPFADTEWSQDWNSSCSLSLWWENR
jgi:hypothetical protein